MALGAYAKLVTSARRAKRRTANRVSADDILDAIVGGVPGSKRQDGLIDFGSGAIRSRRLPMCDGGAFEYTICVLGAPAGRSRRRGGGAGPQYPRDPWDRLKLEPEVPAEEGEGKEESKGGRDDDDEPGSNPPSSSSSSDDEDEMGVDYSVVEEPDELVASEEMDADDGYASLDEQEQRSRRVSGVHDRSPSVLASGGRGKKKQRAGVRVYLRVTQLISRRWAHHPCYLQPPRGDVCTVGRVTASSSTAAGSSSTASDHDVREPEPVAAAPTLERIQRGRHVIKIEPLDCAPPYEWRQRVITERFERLRVEFKLRVLKRDTRDTTTFGKRLDAAYESRAAKEAASNLFRNERPHCQGED